MSDLIDRQAAIEALELQAKEMSRWVERYTEQAKGVLTAKNIIEDLPSAEPEQLGKCPIYGGVCLHPSDQCYECPRHAGAERKTGKWILDSDGMDWNLPAWRCSLCGCRNNNIGVVAKGEGLGQNPLMWSGSKYCPNCGADMREGEQNEKD